MGMMAVDETRVREEGGVVIESVKTRELEAEKQYHKGVKHLWENGVSRLPSKYILPFPARPLITRGAHDQDHNNNNNNNNNLIQLPIIDFAELQGPNRSRALKALASACQEYGLFQLVNHGVSRDVMRGMLDVGRRFFDMPMEERTKHMSADMHAPVRYGTSFNQNKDGVFCWRDFLKLSCYDDTLWPTSPVDLREVAVTYSKETKVLFLRLMEGIVESLGLCGATKNNEMKMKMKMKMKRGDDDDDDDEAAEILKTLEDGSQLMVVNCFPPCPEPHLTLGMPPHSDYAFLTLLLNDDVQGLQIHHHDKWLTVQPISNAFVVNVGDHLEIFSNGLYKSVLHRVLANSTSSRISVATLHSLPFECMAKPSSSLINEANPRRYKDTNFATFLRYISSCEPKNKDFLESRKISN